MPSKPIHAVIISWDGFQTQARAMAEGLHGAVDKLSVIYSNAQDREETGPGSWHKVPQSWFFGRKFQVSLTLNPHDAVMLQINADAQFDDWPAVVRQLRNAVDEVPDLGIWAPDLDWTPWLTSVVQKDTQRPDGLIDVVQTDGVCWALTPAVLSWLQKLDYSSNNIGWGIDWASSAHCHAAGLAVVRDPSLLIRHPEGRGYDGEEADRQSLVFLAQLDAQMRSWISQTRQGAEARHLALWDAHKAPLSMPLPAEGPKVAKQAPVPAHHRHRTGVLEVKEIIEPPHLCEIALMDGQVFVAANGNLEGRDICIDADGEVFTLEKVDMAKAGLLPPVTFPIHPDPEGWPTQQDGFGEWQVAHWTTYRVIGERVEGVARIPLKGKIEILATGEPLRFDAKLSAHRGRGRLVLEVTEADGKHATEVKLPFDPRFPGGNRPDQFHRASVQFTPRKGPISVSLILEYEAPPHENDNSAAFFIAEPQLAVANEKSAQLNPAVRVIAPTQTPVWHRCALPASRRGAKSVVALVSEGTRYELSGASNVHLSLSADWGHLLEFQSNMAFRGVVYIDDEVAFPYDFQSGHNGFRIPSRFLNGRHRKIEVRDEMGFQTYWSSWFLAPRQLTPFDHLQRESRSPYPAEIFAQSPARFTSLRAHAKAGVTPEVSQQLSIALDALEAGYDGLKIKPLAFPEVEAPDVSVVIPAHNKVKVTYACMCALLLAHNKATFEVILVDDGSTDETAKCEEIVSGITVIHNTDAQRFIRACNTGAAQARGKYVVLLNNDTEPTSGWLDEMIDAFGRFDKVGLVGSKLLYPDGRLQEAGGIIWGTGDPWNYGRLENPADPRFSYARQADYLSGAAMMTTKEIWDEVGGLSSYLEPMYFEDTDFAFKIRDHGYTTWFVPSSVVYHYEGVTSGTDTSSGFKRFQEVNRPKFKRQWGQAYRNFSEVGHKPDLEKDRGIVGRVLFIDYTTPTPDRDAGSYAALQEIKLVQSLGYKVTFLPENLAYMGDYTHALEKQGVEMIVAPYHMHPHAYLDEHARDFDCFYITRYHVVNNMVGKIRELVPDAKIIMNGADFHYLRLLRKGITENSEKGIEEATGVREEELAAMHSVDVVLSYNDTEMAIIEAMSEGRVSVLRCPWVLDIPGIPKDRSGREGISFLGSFQHHPNIEGLEWLAKNVMSVLAEKRPDIVLSIYGSRMDERVRKLASPVINPVGFVEDVADAYDPHRVFVAPLLAGAGIKGKVLSALAAGIPTVLSPVAAEGIGLRDEEDCLIAEKPSDWVEKITRLHDDEALWIKIQENGLKVAKQRFNFSRAREQMRDVFEAAEIFKSLR
ncbi:glycosyltransferase [Mesobacterium pallidum]|uniref:glycosyltransferase n=1 Tax=Mesobacterium pallidum TaxID=2872037 RepID=UPI001EE26ED6|nr:glycosyltransferase [Mesobacterium pallidum]